MPTPAEVAHLVASRDFSLVGFHRSNGAIASILALASWRLVEKPFLNLKAALVVERANDPKGAVSFG
jgi:peptidoglycan/LPS O-acetylase OafA/YrhL